MGIEGDPTETALFQRGLKKGREDTFEFCLMEIEKAATKEDAMEQISYYLTKVKENKFEEMRKDINRPIITT